MSGVRRAHWVQSRRLVASATGTLDAFGQHGIDAMVLKGAALADAYDTPALRPMADLDVLVRPHDVVAAAQLLEHLGYRGPDVRASRHISCRHADAFIRSDHHAIDLHWIASRHLGPSGVSRAQWRRPWWAELAADEWWERSRPAELNGVPIRVPSTTDLLLHVILHGCRLGNPDEMRWVADAAAIVKNRGDDIDWELLVDQARRRHVAGALAAAVEFLALEIALDVPSSVRHELAATRTSSRERLVGRLSATADARPPGRTRTMLQLAARYAALTANEPAPSTAWGFPWFVTHWVGGDHPAAVLRAAVGRGGLIR